MAECTHELPAVLFVDDDPNVLSSFKRSFRYTYSVETAGNGREGMQRILDGLEVDVVVTDMKMPEMGGLELLAELKAIAPDVPGIMLTGYAELQSALTAINQGNVFRFLTKPCEPEVLGSAIEEALTKSKINTARMALLAGKQTGETVRGMVNGLHAFVSLRDPYTAAHQRSVADMCVTIGKQMKLSPEFLEDLEMAALVHDIGKLYVPAEILSRTGRLRDHEFLFIKEHVRVGYEVFKPIAEQWAGAEMVRQHHERLDGSGYPQGLEGDEICLGARILAVADTLDAMSTHRPYRPSLGMAVALQEIRNGRGTLYDPDVVDAHMNVMDPFANIP